MAVERPLETPMSPMMEGEALEIEIVDPESVSISSGDETFFEFDADDLQGEVPHDANLAEFIEDDVLNGIASDLIGAFKADKESRSDWERSFSPASY